MFKPYFQEQYFRENDIGRKGQKKQSHCFSLILKGANVGADFASTGKMSFLFPGLQVILYDVLDIRYLINLTKF